MEIPITNTRFKTLPTACVSGATLSKVLFASCKTPHTLSASKVQLYKIIFRVDVLWKGMSYLVVQMIEHTNPEQVRIELLCANFSNGSGNTAVHKCGTFNLHKSNAGYINTRSRKILAAQRR